MQEILGSLSARYIRTSKISALCCLHQCSRARRLLCDPTAGSVPTPRNPCRHPKAPERPLGDSSVCVRTEESTMDSRDGGRRALGSIRLSCGPTQPLQSLPLPRGALRARGRAGDRIARSLPLIGGAPSDPERLDGEAHAAGEPSGRRGLLRSKALWTSARPRRYRPEQPMANARAAKGPSVARARSGHPDAPTSSPSRGRRAARARAHSRSVWPPRRSRAAARCCSSTPTRRAPRACGATPPSPRGGPRLRSSRWAPR